MARWFGAFALIAFFALGPVAPAAAADPVITIVIKNHRFQPSEVTVPVGKRIRLIVDNQDPTPEEFESHSLKREKVIRGNSKATILIGPLKAGTYDFFGEFNEDTAQGKIIAK
jgi:hypothetical protein